MCQYSVAPASLLARPQFMASPGHGSLQLNWHLTSGGWAPSGLLITACHVADLGAADTEVTEVAEVAEVAGARSCVEVDTELAGEAIIIPGLRTFAEYELQINSTLEFFNLSSSTRVRGRTRE